MTMRTVERTWRQRLTLATVTGVVAGITRAIVGWVIDHISSASV